jgi:hypothetical protein
MKLDRATFLYMGPSGSRISQFAQCLTCRDWVTGDRKCVIHGPRVRVPGSASCGLYVQGVPQPAGTPTLIRVTPEESGLVNRDVRCENCIHFDKGKCEFFDKLNKALPELFDLDTEVDSHGCCNAQTPGE